MNPIWIPLLAWIITFMCIKPAEPGTANCLSILACVSIAADGKASVLWQKLSSFLLQLGRGQVTECLAMFSLYFKLLCKMWLTLLYYGKVVMVFFPHPCYIVSMKICILWGEWGHIERYGHFDWSSRHQWTIWGLQFGFNGSRVGYARIRLYKQTGHRQTFTFLPN